ncbi:MAG: tRNA pseudouridine(55) synthase TruB [Acidobacteriota bacterium]
MDGVLVIDKPAGLTSHDVVARVRRILQERRVGHTGTLDPFATGVLVILIGRATRLAQFLSGAEKEYEAVVRLGYATETGDHTGQPIVDPDPNAVGIPSVSWSDAEIETALASLRGELDQVPPMYSAKKQDGRKLYELARRGETVERKAVRVTVSEFASLRSDEQLLRHNSDGTIDLRVRVVCSAGTYVRTLAEALGERLGVGAHLAELRRTRAGDFGIGGASSLEQLQERLDHETLATVILPPDTALQRMPFVSLNSEETQRTRQGVALRLQAEPAGISIEGQNIRMRDEAGELIAIGNYDRSAQLIKPRVVLAENH